MRDSSKQYLHGFQIPLEGRVCTAAEQTADGHLFSSLQYVVQAWRGSGLNVLEWLVAPPFLHRKPTTVFPQRKEWVKFVFPLTSYVQREFEKRTLE